MKLIETSVAIVARKPGRCASTLTEACSFDPSQPLLLAIRVTTTYDFRRVGANRRG